MKEERFRSNLEIEIKPLPVGEGNIVLTGKWNLKLNFLIDSFLKIKFQYQNINNIIP